jgi:hypothetical protein
MAVQTVLVTGSAARPGGVRRTIRASTGQLFLGHRGSFPVRPETPVATKVLAEVAAQVYAHGLEVFVICCGWGPRSPEQVRELQQSAGLPLGAPRYALRPVRELLGHEPRDRWPENLDLVTFGGAMRGDPP